MPAMSGMTDRACLRAYFQVHHDASGISSRSFTLSKLQTAKQASPAGTSLQGPLSAADVFALSAAAKLGATVVTYPLQLIKARQMSSGKHTHADRQYTGTLNAILRIWKSEGLLILKPAGHVWLPFS